MYKNILKKLRCPICKASLELSNHSETNDEVITGELHCKNNHHWEIRDGVIDFNSKEQEFSNTWSKLYAKYNYNELDQIIKRDVPVIQKQAYEVTFEEMINEIKTRNAETF